MARGRGGLEWSQVRVGVVIVLAIVVFIMAIFSVGKLLNIFAKRYTVVTLVESAAGLPMGAAVTLAGQRVGQVAAIEFIPMTRKQGKNNVLIRLAIAREVAEQIRHDSKAMLRTQGLLGDKYIDIVPGSLHTAALQPNDTLPMQQPVDFDVLLANAGSALDTTRVMVSDLRSLTRRISSGQGTLGKLVMDDAMYRDVDASMLQLRTTLAAFNDPNGSMGRMMHDPALYNRMVSAISRVDSLGAMIAAGHGSLGKLLTRDDVYNGLLGTVNRADSAVGGLADLTKAFRGGNGTLQRLMTDPGLYDQFLKAVVDLQTMINDVRAQPKKYTPNVNVKIF
ncbi:MAG TPA: MlaD family protein [Longimicrobiales bacterium]